MKSLFFNPEFLFLPLWDPLQLPLAEIHAGCSVFFGQGTHSAIKIEDGGNVYENYG